MVAVEPAGHRIDAIGLFGDGDGDDPNRRIGQQRQDFRLVLGARQALDHRADHLGVIPGSTARHDRIKPVLCGEIMDDIDRT